MVAKFCRIRSTWGLENYENTALVLIITTETWYVVGVGKRKCRCVAGLVTRPLDELFRPIVRLTRRRFKRNGIVETIRGKNDKKRKRTSRCRQEVLDVPSTMQQEKQNPTIHWGCRHQAGRTEETENGSGDMGWQRAAISKASPASKLSGEQEVGHKGTGFVGIPTLWPKAVLLPVS
jgi:hypothetical protein